jgi:chromosome segregation ATPase
MAFTRKKPADEYRIPSLAEASPEFAALLQKQVELQNRQSELRKERREVEREIAVLPSATHNVSARVAELLGDEPDSAPMLKKRLAEIRNAERVTEDATEIVRRRLADARGPASVAVCAAVKPEYTRRVKAMVAAVTALHAAREDYESLLNDLVANDVAWTSLVPMQPSFCGDRHDGHLDRYLRAAKEAGYHV